MKAILAVSVAAAAVACGPAGAEPETSDHVRRAQLVVVSYDPLVVRGLRFRPGERVKLLVAVDGRATPSSAVRASRAGRFNARLGVSARPDRPLVVQAIGACGSRASVDVTAPTDTLAPSP